MEKNMRNGGKLSQRFILLSCECSFRKLAVLIDGFTSVCANKKETFYEKGAYFQIEIS